MEDNQEKKKQIIKESEEGDYGKKRKKGMRHGWYGDSGYRFGWETEIRLLL